MKKYIISIILSFAFFIFHSSCFSQNAKIDSILILVKADKPDTNKVKHLNDLSRQFNKIGSYDSAMFYANSALTLSNAMLRDVTDPNVKQTMQKCAANSYNTIANVYTNQCNYPASLKNNFASLKIREAIGDKKGLASSYNNIGVVYFNQGNYPEALKYNLASLKMEEAAGHKEGVATSYNNIGLIYANQGNFSESLKNHFASLKISEAISDKNGIANSYNNIGIIYKEQSNYPEALKYYFASLKIKEELGNKKSIVNTYNNIGSVYAAQADQESNPLVRTDKLNMALKNYFLSLKLSKEIVNKAKTAGSYNNIGDVLFQQKKFKEAEEYLNKAKELSLEIGFKECLKSTYSELTKLDSSRGNYKGAYENHKLYIVYRDSLDNEESRKKTIESQMTYDFDKKEAVADAEHKKELENQQILATEKNRKQKVVLLLVSCFLALVLVFAGFVFRSLRVTRKQKDIIEVQKQLVDEKQKEILDSIYYARRIQQSLLPTEKYIDKNLNHLMKK